MFWYVDFLVDEFLFRLYSEEYACSCSYEEVSYMSLRTGLDLSASQPPFISSLGVLQEIKSYINATIPANPPDQKLVNSTVVRFGPAVIDLLTALFPNLWVSEGILSAKKIDDVVLKCLMHYDETLRKVLCPKYTKDPRNGCVPLTRQALMDLYADISLCTSHEELERLYPHIVRIRPNYLWWCAKINRDDLTDKIHFLLRSLRKEMGDVMRDDAIFARVTTLVTQLALTITQTPPSQVERFEHFLSFVKYTDL